MVPLSINLHLKFEASVISGEFDMGSDFAGTSSYRSKYIVASLSKHPPKIMLSTIANCIAVYFVCLFVCLQNKKFTVCSMCIVQYFARKVIT